MTFTNQIMQSDPNNWETLSEEELFEILKAELSKVQGNGPKYPGFNEKYDSFLDEFIQYHNELAEQQKNISLDDEINLFMREEIGKYPKRDDFIKFILQVFDFNRQFLDPETDINMY